MAGKGKGLTLLHCVGRWRLGFCLVWDGVFRGFRDGKMGMVADWGWSSLAALLEDEMKMRGIKRRFEQYLLRVYLL
jgi:hypothetical protein